MRETLGGLVDRLITTALKLWFVQEEVMRAAREGRGLDAETTKRLADLNLQRNRLMTGIDEELDRSLRAGKAEVDSRVKLDPS